MIYTINELRNQLFSRIFEVYDIFRNFFGEEVTDLQGIPDISDIDVMLDNMGIPRIDGSCDVSNTQLATLKSMVRDAMAEILVWWPMVVVSNENNRSIVIKDLYANILITTDGRIPYESRGFRMVRTTFDHDQWFCGYSHSHLPRHFTNRAPEFLFPCLGDGPINGTILELKNSYEEATWMLFCQELDMYVRVESLTGGPYIRLETVGTRYSQDGYSDFTTVEILKGRFINLLSGGNQDLALLKDFVLWYLEHGHLCLNFNNESFICGMSYYRFMIDISNAFIEWCNRHVAESIVTEFRNCGLLVLAKTSEGKFYRNEGSRTTSTSDVEGLSVINFKGESKLLHIEGITSDENVVRLLDNDVAMFILGKILKTVNYRFINEQTRLPESGSTQEGASAAYKEVYYL